MNLLDRLREQIKDDRDIEAVLLSASGSSGYSGLPNGWVEIYSGAANSKPYVSLKFRSGRITQLKIGQTLSSLTAQDALVDRARVEIAHIHGYKIVERHLLTSRKLTGSYQYKDRLRIDPCPVNVPIGDGLNFFGQSQGNSFGDSADGPPYPFSLRIRIPSSPNHTIETNRTLDGLDTVQRLLTLLVSGNIHTFATSGERIWTLVKREEKLENHLLHPGFTGGDNYKLPEFATPLDKHAPIYEGEDYYNHLWELDANISMPATLNSDLETFETLDVEEKSAFKRAIYWYDLGLRNRKESAISTTALSTAVECLLPKTKRLRCNTCSSEVGLGPTRLFKLFLERYGTVPESLHKNRTELYNIRSELVHGGFAAAVDTSWRSAARHTDDHSMLLELVTRRSLIHWLRDQDRKNWNATS